MRLYIQQRVLTILDKLEVRNEDGDLVYRVQGEWAWGRHLKVYDDQERVVAVLEKKIFSWLSTYTIEIGHEVRELVREFALLPRFRLEGSPWKLQGDFWAHEYSITHGTEQIASISKAWFTWGDSYVMDITHPENELLCVCILLAIDAIKADRRKR